MDDAKEIWEAIRIRFGGKANSKKMQKAILKQQFEAFTVSSTEGLEKGYEKFQHLLSQLEAHGSPVSTEDANHKFLRSLPYEWTNVTMSMRLKEGVDDWSIDDLFNNLRVFEQDIKGSSKPSSSAANVAFVGQGKTNTNKVSSGSYASSSNNIKERDIPAGFADEVIQTPRTEKLPTYLHTSEHPQSEVPTPTSTMRLLSNSTIHNRMKQPHPIHRTTKGKKKISIKTNNTAHIQSQKKITYKKPKTTTIKKIYAVTSKILKSKDLNQNYKQLPQKNRKEIYTRLQRNNFQKNPKKIKLYGTKIITNIA
ncbi:hypothetical protein CTI12_AA521220 [Artemisia annua]|uniref:Uncharacterized protein n=1 Tax=Artemisia annua TaxID=35608 RepID=A0A2U1L7R9_ARTAN|nr:hypothetical protein CTI12_AA521220 [Artemisia annua]